VQAALPKLARWADMVTTGEADRFNETVIEGQGARDPLDRPFAGRRLSAVEQGYKYATNLPCDWILLTNLRQLRLYCKSQDQYTYERFDLPALAREEGLLRKFVFLLGAERMLPPAGRSHLYDLLAESERIGAELTREYYADYAGMRRQAFDQLCAANPGTEPGELLAATQKLLDRFLFCAFCEARSPSTTAGFSRPIRSSTGSRCPTRCARSSPSWPPTITAPPARPARS
jgi:hypothetical protein